MAAVHQLQGVGNAAAALLEKLNIFNTDDLLFHLPRDYEDRSTIIPMNQLSVLRKHHHQKVSKNQFLTKREFLQPVFYGKFRFTHRYKSFHLQSDI